MDVELIREYCLSLPHTTEHFPFDEVTLVFKIEGKMYMLISLDNPVKISMKCDPEKALLLREKYMGIEPAHHFNKKHWNQISILGDIPDNLIKELILHSYKLVIAKLPLKIRMELMCH